MRARGDYLHVLVYGTTHAGHIDLGNSRDINVYKINQLIAAERGRPWDKMEGEVWDEAAGIAMAKLAMAELGTLK